MDITLDQLLKGKETKIRKAEFYNTKAYIEPFLDRLSKITDNFDVKVQLPDQVTITDNQDDVTYNRVWIQGILPKSYSVDNHEEVIGMIYGLDVRKPVVKFYRGGLNMACTNLCVFNPTSLQTQELKPQQAIDLIHRAGGIAVLAHPKLVENDTYVNELLDLPFDGVEVYHSSHSTKDSTKYRKIAETRGLLISGGSDFHGIPDRFPESIGLGEYEIQSEWVAEFMKALQGA